MSLPEFYELCRQANRVLPLIAGIWVGLRIGQAWAATWLPESHRWHYRQLAVALLALLLICAGGSNAYQANNAEPVVTSPLLTAVCLAILAICYRWPPDRSNHDADH